MTITGDGERFEVKTPDYAYVFEGPITWSQDGRKVAFLGVGTAEDQAHVFVADADGSGLKRIANAEQFAGGPVWRPSGP